MSWKVYLSTFCIPGLLTVSMLSNYYEVSPVSGRFRFIPLEPSLERQISRKLQKTWGQKMILRHSLVEDKRVERIWSESKKGVGMTESGKVFFLDTEEFIFQVFHTGDLYVSKVVVDKLKDDEIKELFMHQAAHVILKHAQENLVCSKVTAIVLGYLCRHNHHFHYVLKYYQIYPRFTQVQEDEANLLVNGLIGKYNSHVCAHSLMASN